MSLFRRRRKPQDDQKTAGVRSADAEVLAARESAPAPAPAPPLDHGTVFDVRRVQDAADSSTWQGSWQRLSDKVYSHMHAKFGGVRLPYDVEFDDVFSAVLVRMMRDLPRFRLEGRAEFWGWVRRLAKNQIVDEWRRHARLRDGGGRVRQQQAGTEQIDLVEHAPDPEAFTASVMMRARELEAVEEECVQGLTNPRVRKIYLLRRRLELPFAQIARQVGDANADVTRVAFRRAKARVLECLRGKLDDGDLPASW